MRWTKGMMTAVSISILLAVTLSFFPINRGDSHWNHMFTSSEAVFQNTRPVVLNESLLVEFLQAIPTNHAYKHVVLEGPRIFIDLDLLDDQTDTMYDDSLQLMATIYTQSANIEEVYVRFIVKDPSDPHDDVLALNVVSSKDHHLLRDLAKDGVIEDPYTLLQKHTQLIYGSGWRN